MEEQTRSDFDRARHKAFLNDLLASIGRRPNDLIPFHEFRRRLQPEAESYRGMQTVPVRQIVGSMDRFRDFDRAFLPRGNATRGRWQSIDRAYYQDVRLPPIQLYKVGDIYFVKDGNHRVSVARERGVEFIDAEVIEGHVRAPLSSQMSPTELLLQAEYAEFLRRTVAAAPAFPGRRPPPPGPPRPLAHAPRRRPPPRRRAGGGPPPAPSPP